MAAQGYTATIQSGVSTSDSLDLGTDAFRRVYVNNTAGGSIHFHASTDNSTFAPVQIGTTVTAGVGYTTHVVGSAMSGRWVPVDLPFRYIKVEARVAAGDGATVGFSVAYDS